MPVCVYARTWVRVCLWLVIYSHSIGRARVNKARTHKLSLTAVCTVQTLEILGRPGAYEHLEKVTARLVSDADQLF